MDTGAHRGDIRNWPTATTIGILKSNTDPIVLRLWIIYVIVAQDDRLWILK